MALQSVITTAQALPAATVTTALSIVAGSKAIRLVRFGVSFNGADSTKAPVRVELIRLTSNGSSTAYTPKKIDPNSDAALASGRTTFTAEPAYGDILEIQYVSPAGGGFVEVYAPDERINIPAAQMLGLRFLANDAVSVNAFMIFDE